MASYANTESTIDESEISFSSHLLFKWLNNISSLFKLNNKPSQSPSPSFDSFFCLLFIVEYREGGEQYIPTMSRLWELPCTCQIQDKGSYQWISAKDLVYFKLTCKRVI